MVVLIDSYACSCNVSNWAVQWNRLHILIDIWYRNLEHLLETLVPWRFIQLVRAWKCMFVSIFNGMGSNEPTNYSICKKLYKKRRSQSKGGQHPHPLKIERFLQNHLRFTLNAKGFHLASRERSILLAAKQIDSEQIFPECADTTWRYGIILMKFT